MVGGGKGMGIQNERLARVHLHRNQHPKQLSLGEGQLGGVESVRWVGPKDLGPADSRVSFIQRLAFFSATRGPAIPRNLENGWKVGNHLLPNSSGSDSREAVDQEQEWRPLAQSATSHGQP